MKNIVVAYDKQRAIGKNNDMPWHYRDIPRDMANFRELTKGQTVIMGRKTYETIGTPLVDRRNIVISRKALEITGVEVVHSLESAYDLSGENDVYIIGGGQIYAEALAAVDRIYATEIDATFPGSDVFFPEIDQSWSEVDRAHHPADEKNKYNLDFVTYDREAR